MLMSNSTGKSRLHPLHSDTGNAKYPSVIVDQELPKTDYGLQVHKLELCTIMKLLNFI